MAVVWNFILEHIDILGSLVGALLGFLGLKWAGLLRFVKWTFPILRAIAKITKNDWDDQLIAALEAAIDAVHEEKKSSELGQPKGSINVGDGTIK